ncbi:MEDS domain-containing protein [Pseudonocardia lutea]|jgi:anti-anti-sigma factor|uniref:MEDS domain-containing protein n=1 Tax=Pseudonocardia lutea TaxID=2172015 RepID=A0ABW1I2Y7_9PSEU
MSAESGADGTMVPGTWDGHQLLVATREEAAPALAGWTRQGLQRGERLLFAADPAHPDVDGLVTTLADGGLDRADAADAAARGRLVVVDNARFYSMTGFELLVEDACRQGLDGVRTCGGPDSAARVLEPAAFEQFEHMLAKAWATHGVTSLCRYPPSGVTDEDDLRKGIGRHASGWAERIAHLGCPDPGLLYLRGEVDTSNDAFVGALVTEAARQAGPGLVLDCSELVHMSVGGWRAVVRATAPVRERGGRVRLRSLSAAGARVLHATGFAAAFETEPG